MTKIQFPIKGNRLVATITIKNKISDNMFYEEFSLEPVEFDVGGITKNVTKFQFSKNIGSLENGKVALDIDILNRDLGTNEKISVQDDTFTINFIDNNTDDSIEVFEVIESGGEDNNSTTTTAEDTAKTLTASTASKKTYKEKLMRDLKKNDVKEILNEMGVNKDKIIEFIDESAAENLYLNEESGGLMKLKRDKLRKWIENNRESLKTSESLTGSGRTTNTGEGVEGDSTTGTTTGSGDNIGGSTPTTNLLAIKNQAISTIKDALKSGLELANSDLDSDYQRWETKINNYSNENEIADFKDRVLVNIKKVRENKQSSSRIKDELQRVNSPTATIDDKKNVLKNIEKDEGSIAAEENRDQTTNLKKEVARNNVNDYRNNFIAALPNKLSSNGLTENELDSETQTEIKELEKETDPDKLVEKELKITQKIGQQGATKKITTFKKQVEAVLESNNKTEIAKLRKQLIEFIESNNVYCQAKKQEAEELLRKLEKQSLQRNKTQTTSQDNKTPWKVIIPISLVGGILVIGFGVVIVRNRRKRK